MFTVAPLALHPNQKHLKKTKKNTLLAQRKTNVYYGGAHREIENNESLKTAKIYSTHSCAAPKKTILNVTPFTASLVENDKKGKHHETS